MKKLDLSNIVEGVRKLGAVKEFFTHIEQAYEETFAQLTKALVADSGSYILLRGCVNAGAGLDYNISAGAILKDGEYLRWLRLLAQQPWDRCPCWDW